MGSHVGEFLAVRETIKLPKKLRNLHLLRLFQTIEITIYPGLALLSFTYCHHLSHRKTDNLENYSNIKILPFHCLNNTSSFKPMLRNFYISTNFMIFWKSFKIASFYLNFRVKLSIEIKKLILLNMRKLYQLPALSNNRIKIRTFIQEIFA